MQTSKFNPCGPPLLLFPLAEIFIHSQGVYMDHPGLIDSLGQAYQYL